MRGVPASTRVLAKDRTTPDAANPRHIAIIMDGNRRWAKRRFLPLALGHAAGARRVRPLVQACAHAGIEVLSLFAFSTENWRRPPDEVSALMSLFGEVLQREVRDLQAAGVKLQILGDRAGFPGYLQTLIAQAEEATGQGTRLVLNVAANYGGRWDCVQAVQSWQRANPLASVAELTEAALTPHLTTGHLPEVDLLIRTGGEKRISNFMLWQAAYAELYLTPKLWPDFQARDLDDAIRDFARRDRRFGSSAPMDDATPASEPLQPRISVS